MKDKFRTIVFQNSPTTCGQACVAMIVGCTLEGAIERVGHSGKTKYFEVLSAIGINNHEFKKGKAKGNIVALQLHRNEEKTAAHWTVYWHGITLNPSKSEKSLWNVEKHFIIPKKYIG